MILQVFSVYDDKAQCYQTVHPMTHKGAALRSFGDAVLDKNTQLSRHPSDYKLYLIGTFDDSSGLLNPVNPPELIGCGIDFINPLTEIKSNDKDKADNIVRPIESLE